VVVGFFVTGRPRNKPVTVQPGLDLSLAVGKFNWVELIRLWRDLGATQCKIEGEE